MPWYVFFWYCSKNKFLKVSGPRLQFEIFDIPDYFFSNARTLTPEMSRTQKTPEINELEYTENLKIWARNFEKQKS